MDASNPVNSAERFTLEEMRFEHLRKKRQSLQALQDMAQSAERHYFGDGLYNNERYSRVFEALEKATPHFDWYAEPWDLSFLKKMPPIPVDQTKHETLQIHPPNKNIAGGYVSTSRIFGSPQGLDKGLIQGLSQVFNEDELIEAGSKYCYCYGSRGGFQKRLKMLMTRQCKSPYTPPQVATKLKRLMPRGPLPNWHEFDAMMEAVTITAGASAGAPYWKDKRDALHECVGTILPVVVEALNDGSLQTLMNGRPEWFLVEIKNKLDRYEVTKLGEKCRPYGNMPMHLSLLFSALIQPFCKALHVWTKSDTCNAYGMTMCHAELYSWTSRIRQTALKAIKTKKPHYMFGVYGDDGEILRCMKDGTVYAVDPDFKQMDGSVDYNTVKGVCKWIGDSFAKEHGDSPFWRIVLDLLAEMATNPLMIIDGRDTYRKNQKDGIISGVVGTTLFDTAKAAIAYSDYIEQCEYDLSLFDNQDRSVKYFREKHGLEVKEGTWRKTVLNMNPDNAEQLFRETKFLGMQLKWVYDPSFDGPILVPSLPTRDWLELLTTPRDNAETKKKESNITHQRRTFDRCRGLLITGAVWDPDVAEALYMAIDQVPAAAILMEVQAKKGKGAVEAVNDLILNEDFSFPSSEGVPLRSWVAALYALTEEEKEQINSDDPFSIAFQPVYPSLADFIRNRKDTWKERWKFMMKPSTHPQLEVSLKYTEYDFVNTEPPLPPIPVASTSFAKPLKKVIIMEPFKTKKHDGDEVQVAIAPKQSLQSIKEYTEKAMIKDPTPFMAAIAPHLETTGIDREKVVEYAKNYSWVVDREPFDRTFVMPQLNAADAPKQIVRRFVEENGLEYVSPPCVTLDQRTDLKEQTVEVRDPLTNNQIQLARLRTLGVRAKVMEQVINEQFATYLRTLEDVLPRSRDDSPTSSWKAIADAEAVEADTSVVSSVSTSQAARITKDIINASIVALKKELSAFITTELNKQLKKEREKHASTTAKKKRKNGKNGGSSRKTEEVPSGSRNQTSKSSSRRASDDSESHSPPS
ncbi:RdRp [Hubei permutotetra-like virus 3]|uniref:RdRp n=1 Tax=Hubei permutotetra-like virus 3 TaxID=1923077 RepID=UPI00090AC582|nr:RdRp [Hubei permutotetra-like virus 3]APG76948.1 RdRp [Hubei permutotetra-like virus 3]